MAWYSKLRPHQPDHTYALIKALQRGGVALDTSDTGTGKTHTALAAAKALGHTPIVVGTKGARLGWEEAAAVQGVDIEYVNYEKVRARRKQDDGRFLTDNEWLVEQPWGSGSFLKWKGDYGFMIFDEVHKCGGMRATLNRKGLIAAKRQAQNLLMLSATAAESPLQLYAIGYALGLHGMSKKAPIDWHQFLRAYGCAEDWMGQWIFCPVTGDMTPEDQEQARAEHMHRLNARIFPMKGSRMRRCDIPDFPPCQLEVMLLEDTTGKAAKLTDALHEAYAARRQQQAHADGMVEAIRDEQALELLMIPSLVEQMPKYSTTSKCIFFVTFRETVHELVAALHKAKYSVGWIEGEQPVEERNSFIRDFQNSRLDALVVNSAAGGESLNMQRLNKGDVTTFITPVKSGKQAEQIIGRAWRHGGGFSLQFFVFFKGTRQEKIAEKMRAKRCNIHALNGGDWLV